MLGWQVRSPTAAIVGIGLSLGLMAAAVVPLVKAQTPAQTDRARKAYEEHMRRMDEAEKTAPAKPATPASPPTVAAPRLLHRRLQLRRRRHLLSRRRTRMPRRNAASSSTAA